CRVRSARILEALVRADRVLRKGGRQRDRRDDRAGRRVGFLAGVDRAGLERVVLPAHVLVRTARNDSTSERVSTPIGWPPSSTSKRPSATAAPVTIARLLVNAPSGPEATSVTDSPFVSVELVTRTATDGWPARLGSFSFTLTTSGALYAARSKYTSPTPAVGKSPETMIA